MRSGAGQSLNAQLMPYLQQLPLLFSHLLAKKWWVQKSDWAHELWFEKWVLIPQEPDQAWNGKFVLYQAYIKVVICSAVVNSLGLSVSVYAPRGVSSQHVQIQMPTVRHLTKSVLMFKAAEHRNSHNPRCSYVFSALLKIRRFFVRCLEIE